ncbi:MAG: hypothetical protein ACYDAG_14435 [Chloroflexota bacterium]
MRLTFERGNAQRPRGHALLYFHAGGGDSLLATYVVIPPILIDFSKYLPPMFAAQGMAGNLAEASSVVPLPPVPEAVPGLGTLRTLADKRDDDLVEAGDIDTGQVEQMLLFTNEAAQLYYHLYQDFRKTFPEAAGVEPEQLTGQGPSPEDLTYALMGERERLGELVRLSGTLRYALEGNDQPGVQDTVEKMRALAGHLAPKYWADRVVDAARTPGERGAHLSQLYIDRCYKLLEEDYAAVERVETEIQNAK